MSVTLVPLSASVRTFVLGAAEADGALSMANARTKATRQRTVVTAQR